MSSSIDFKLNTNATNINQVFKNKDIFFTKRSSHVYELFHKKTKKPLDYIIKTYKDFTQAVSEMSRLDKLKNINGVVKMVCNNLNLKFSFVILVKSGQEDLHTYMSRKTTININKIKDIIKQLLTIVNKIHFENIYHGDIKPENIVLEHCTGEITLIDFEENRYTKEYQSPESIKKRLVNEKADIWCIGIVCFLLLFSYDLFDNEKEILNNEVDIPEYRGTLTQDFLYCLLDKNPKSRYTCNEALQHQWIKN